MKIRDDDYLPWEIGLDVILIRRNHTGKEVARHPAKVTKVGTKLVTIEWQHTSPRPYEQSGFRRTDGYADKQFAYDRITTEDLLAAEEVRRSNKQFIFDTLMNRGGYTIRDDVTDDQLARIAGILKGES